MKKLFLVLLFVPLVSFGQNDGYDLCFELRNRSFDSNKDAISSLQKVLSVANLKTNRFVILPCDNIGNAMASVYEGFRYILYKESWMSESDYWSKMAILAHEVGHHINGHTLSGYSLAENKRVELEADDWAGYAMAKLGASLTETLELTKRFSEGDDTNSTHPNRAKRIAALTNGWNVGSEKSTLKGQTKPPEKYVPDNPNMSAAEYYNRGYDKGSNDDYYGAVSDFTKAIELAPNNANAFTQRAYMKSKLKDFKGTRTDSSKAIELAPNNADAYYIRGYVKTLLNFTILRNDYYDAKTDFDKVIEIEPGNINAYYFRGRLKAIYGYNKEAVIDYDKAINLAPTNREAYYYRASAKRDLEDYYGAIADYTIAIKIKPNNTNAYWERGNVKRKLGDINGACADWNKSKDLGSKNGFLKMVLSLCN